MLLIYNHFDFSLLAKVPMWDFWHLYGCRNIKVHSVITSSVRMRLIQDLYYLV